MAQAPFVYLSGQFKIGANAGAATDCKDALSGITIRASRQVVEIPATAANGTPTPVAGATSYEVEFDLLGDDVTASSFFQQLWDATDPTTNPTGTLYFEGTLHGTGAVGPSNPKWSGNFIVSGAALGAKIGDPVSDHQVFRMTGRPAKATA